MSSNILMDPIGRMMGLRYKSHPWHGIDIGDKAPDLVTAFIEVVPTDTVKYEVDKRSGYLTIDRPQKYSNVVPALYGFLPQTYCGDLIGKHCAEKVGKDKIKGDGDPIDICVLTEKNIFHGNILARAIPIGGFRMIDKDDADDKIIAVLQGDATYGNFKDISELPTLIVDRLRHYFLTYKDMPGESRNAEITHIYGYQEAREIIIHAMNDYKNKFDRLNDIIDVV